MSEAWVKGTPMKYLEGYLTPSEVKRLLDATRRFRDKLLFRILWATGCRISELVGDSYHDPPFDGVRIKDILWNESVIIMDTLKRKEVPPPRRRVVIDEITMAMIRKYVVTKNLKGEDKLLDITRQRAWQIILELGERIGVEKIGEKRIHPHHLRHSHCIAWIRDNNTLEGLRQLQQRLAHANINTTAHYLQFAIDESKGKVEKTFGKW